MKIYLDILFLLNLFITFLLLKGTAVMMHRAVSKYRMLLGSVLGGACSLVILWEVQEWLLFFFKLVIGVGLMFVTFFPGCKQIRREGWLRFLKCGFCFVVVNYLFGGFILALWMFAPIRGMFYQNGVVYFDISALTLALSTAAAYLVITLVSGVWNQRTKTEERAELFLRLNGREVQMNAFTDSGNRLSDIFTGLPVIVCEYDAAKPLFPERAWEFFRDPGGFSFDGMEDSRLACRLKVIPVQTAAGEGVLPAFLPDTACVDGRSCRAVVAVTDRRLSDGSYQALLPSAVWE